MADIGSIIKSGRKDKELTLKQLGEKLSLTPGYLSNIENNKRTPSKLTLGQISRVLNLDMGELFFLAGYWDLEQKKQNESLLFGFGEFEYQAYISEVAKNNHIKINELFKEDKKFYINNSLIPKKEMAKLIQIIEVLYDRKSNDYPSLDEIEKEFNKEVKENIELLKLDKLEELIELGEIDKEVYEFYDLDDIELDEEQLQKIKEPWRR